MTESIVAAANNYLQNGLSVIPIAFGTKKAAKPWKQFQHKCISPQQVASEFKHGEQLAIICGTISGNLECLDFDKPELFQPFLETLEAINPPLRTKLTLHQNTVSGGHHIIYRCSDPTHGNQKLACSAKYLDVNGKQKQDVYIETRGQGGYFLVAPSKGYTLHGCFSEIPHINQLELNQIYSVARSFDEGTLQLPTPPLIFTNTEDRPGDLFNRETDWRELLSEHGWTYVRTICEHEHWTRPGKQDGSTSATLNERGLFCFSTSTPLPAEVPLSQFAFYTYYHHAGDFSAAAKTLEEQLCRSNRPGELLKSFEDWPEPLPLTNRIEEEPYPLDALPSIAQRAVEEVLSFTKAPVPLVASSALAAIALAAQAHVDVKRAEKLTGPVSLFLLTIADSGERKSTCDKFFTTAIQKYQQEQAELAKPQLKDYTAAIDAWSAKRAGLMEKLKQLIKKGESTASIEQNIQDMERAKPEQPKVPKLLRGDETPENLAWALAHEWPSAGVASSEAGVVFGAHGMGKESIMRHLALLNILWDGGELSIGRRTSESFTLRGSRLTMALQVQEATLRSFFDRSGDLARGTGFLARFLIAWPESTQGFRPFTAPPSSWPALTAFNQRITDILNTPVPFNEEGVLSPLMFSMTSEAHSKWVAFHDLIEGELRSGGQLYDVRDVASKVADNAARIAALFQIFEDGIGGAVSSVSFDSASRVAAWHLNEARRFFGELALLEEQKNAAILSNWLLDYCRRENVETVARRTIQQFGPNVTRQKDKLEPALQILENLDRLQIVANGQQKTILINPKLFKEVRQ